MKNDYYKKGPKNIPESLTKPSKSFKRKVFFAFTGLILFATIYIALMVWFAIHSYHLFTLVSRGADNVIFLVITGICFFVLSLFMFKSLFLFKKKQKNEDRELTKEDEPILFDFIHKVAEETGAPKPNKIYLSPRVNACVFYDLSFINLLIPSKKNLEIGLGLVNVLNLTEFKAILAHEFGHFAQKSMLLGRYVYVAQQIAVRIVHKRDALDRGLSVLGSVDLRIAWIGWILMVLVWAIRAFIQVLFGIVAISERALSREMEFQADRVAVSVTGSDALIYALHKLRAADEGYHAGIATIEELLSEKKAAPNLFSLQANYIRGMQSVLGDEDYGSTPKEATQDSNYRIFNNQLINPPEMWSTHPSDMDRESNAKEHYVFETIDERSSLELFRDSTELFKSVTANLISTAEVKTEIISEEESLETMNKQNFKWTFLDPKYKGVYLFRKPFSYHQNTADIYNYNIGGDLTKAYSLTYPDSLKDNLDLHRELLEEISLLQTAKNEIRTGEKRKIIHRGSDISRKQIPEIITELEHREKEIRKVLIEHDQLCRKVNFEAAKLGHKANADYHKSLSGLIHFCEHSQNNLMDLHSKLQHTLYVVMADGKVSDSEHLTVQEEARAMHIGMSKTMEFVDSLEMNKELLLRIDIKSKSDLFEEFKFESPNNENLESWINHYSSWVNTILGSLSRLRNGALGELLVLEDRVRKSFEEQSSPVITCLGFKLGDSYDRLVPGDERDLGIKLRFWDKFQGGIGLFPTIAKFAVAALIIVAALFAGTISSPSQLYINNGLSQGVNVTVNGENYHIDAFSYLQIEVEGSADIVTKLTNGNILETLDEDVESLLNYVYNVAGGSYLLEYNVNYGEEVTIPDNFIGPKKWFLTSSDYIFETPPETIYIGTGENKDRKALTIIEPSEIVYLTEDQIISTNVKKLVLTHLKIDGENDPYIGQWINLVSVTDNPQVEVRKRIKAFPKDVASHRYLQDTNDDDARDELGKLLNQSFKDKIDPNYLYLFARNMPDGPEQDSAFIQSQRKWKHNPWLAQAAGYHYAAMEEWKKASDAYHIAARSRVTLDNVASLLYTIDRYLKELGIEVSNEEILSDEISYQLAIESGDESYDLGINLMYYQLHEGEVTKAILTMLTAEKDYQPYLHWVIAASYGASKPFIKSTMELDVNSSLEVNNVAIAVGLLAANDRNYDAALDKLSIFYGLSDEETGTVRSFIKHVKSGSIFKANQDLKTFGSYRIKIYCKLIGEIILRDKTPKSWSIQVKSLMFKSERPFFNNL